MLEKCTKYFVEYVQSSFEREKNNLNLPYYDVFTVNFEHI